MMDATGSTRVNRVMEVGGFSSILPKPKKVVEPLHQTGSTDVIHANTRSEAESSSNSSMGLVMTVVPKEYDEVGNVKYDALAKVGHSCTRVLQTRLEDMQSNLGKVWTKPGAEEIARQTAVTKAALEKILDGKIKASQPKNVETGGGKGSEEFMRITGNDGMQRIVRVVDAPKDPMEPPKFHHKKAVRPPPSPPAPVLHSPPRKVTAEEQAAWKIPPCISNWKNAKGYTIPLDKRLAADGRGLIENKINSGFASFAESLYLAEQHARTEVEKRAAVEQKLVEQQKRNTEEKLRGLAEQARAEKARIAAEIAREARGEGRREGLTLQERERIRRDKGREQERELRLSRMSADQRSRLLEREQDRDVSEKIALGRPVAVEAVGDSMFDQRLFDQTSGISSGFGDDESYNLYSKPLFGSSAAAAHIIYKPRVASGGAGEEEDEDGYSVGSKRKAFSGASEQPVRTGPVEFERADPFGLEQLLHNAKEASK